MLLSAPAVAEVAPDPCPAYEIEGSIEPTSNDLSAAGLASVYLHTGSEPLADHQVFATFTTQSGEAVGEPVMMTTNSEGRSVVPVPDGATNVSFVAEGPDNPVCVDGADANVALEIAMAGAEVPGEFTPSGLSETGPDGSLAYTGPVTTGVVAAAVVVGAVGCGVWMGRGRKVRIAE